jgi:hypothetical protein
VAGVKGLIGHSHAQRVLALLALDEHKLALKQVGHRAMDIQFSPSAQHIPILQ